ncbi:putative DNA helicase chromatin remodeling SNF2 family [Helianthus debilis subsp. tardiflorus]
MGWVNPNYTRYLHNSTRYISGHVPSHVKSLVYLNLSLYIYIYICIYILSRCLNFFFKLQFFYLYFINWMLQDRLVKVVSFVVSLLDNIKKPILILASSGALSLWKLEFSKRSKSVNVVTYNGNKDIRAAIKDLEFQVLLSSPDGIVEDMEIVDRIKWALLVLEECQRPIFSTHLKKLQMVTADMKLLAVSSESVVCFLKSFILKLETC